MHQPPQKAHHVLKGPVQIEDPPGVLVLFYFKEVGASKPSSGVDEGVAGYLRVCSVQVTNPRNSDAGAGSCR